MLPPLLLPEDGGSTVLRNVFILPQHYTASQPRTRLELPSFFHKKLSSVNRSRKYFVSKDFGTQM